MENCHKQARHGQRELRITSKQNIDREISREIAEHRSRLEKAGSSRTQVVSLDSQFDFKSFPDSPSLRTPLQPEAGSCQLRV